MVDYVGVIRNVDSLDVVIVFIEDVVEVCDEFFF